MEDDDDEDEGKTELLGINHQMCIDRCTCSLTDGLNVGRKRVLHNYLAITCTEDLARFSLKCIHIFWVACLWPEYSIQRQGRIKWAKDASCMENTLPPRATGEKEAKSRLAEVVVSLVIAQSCSSALELHAHDPRESVCVPVETLLLLYSPTVQDL